MEKGKITKFADIPPYTKSGSYRINVGWDFLEEHLRHWSDTLIPGGGLELDPDFQRAHVWTLDKQIAYVEYILRDGKSSRVIYWNCSSWMKRFDTPIQLVDGKQRLEAVRRFLGNELKAFGSYFKEFEDSLRRVGPDFIFEMNDLRTLAEVLQWYLDLNTGGVVHTNEEIEKVKTLLEKEKLTSK